MGLTRRPFVPLVTLATTAALVLLTVDDPVGQVASGRTRRDAPADATPVVRGLRTAPPSPLRSRPNPTTAERRLPAARYAPDRVIVKFKDGVSAERAGSAVRGAVSARRATVRGGGAYTTLELAPGSDPDAAARALAAEPDVEFAQPDYLRPALFVPNDPLFHLQWGLMQVGMERAWDVNAGASRSVTVAVIDSGMAFEDAVIEFEADEFTLEGVDYPALGVIQVPFAAAGDLVDSGRIVAPFDFIWGDETPVDLSGHGSHVAGTLGQLTNNRTGGAGVAFDVRLMPLKVLADEWDLIFGAVDVCCGALDSDVADAIRYAVRHGADVINMSLGGPDPSPAIDDAVRFAVERGVFVVIAGGNSFEEGNETTHPAVVAADVDEAMSVAAVDRHERRAYYSNTGSYIEIAAPGGDQRTDGFDGVVQQTLDPDVALTFLRPPSQFEAPRFDTLAFVFLQGTSMAAPHVAGLGALLKAQGISDPAVIEAAITATARDLGAPGDDDEYGAGLIDAAALVRGLGLAR